MRAGWARAAISRLLVLAVVAVAVTGSRCDKGADFFDPMVGGDGTVAPGSIVGTVVVGGSPRPGIVLTLDGDGTTTTDGSGAYAFDPVAPGEHTVVVTPPPGSTCDPGSRTVDVDGGETVTADFECTTPLKELIAGDYRNEASLVQQSGPCSFPASFSNPGPIDVDVVASGDDCIVTVHSDTEVTGAIDEETGQWSGSGTEDFPEDGVRLEEILDGTWRLEEGTVVFEGTLTYVLSDLESGSQVCRATYDIRFEKLD